MEICKIHCKMMIFDSQYCFTNISATIDRIFDICSLEKASLILLPQSLIGKSRHYLLAGLLVVICDPTCILIRQLDNVFCMIKTNMEPRMYVM